MLLMVVLILLMWIRYHRGHAHIEYVPVAISIGSIIIIPYILMGGTRSEYELVAQFAGIKV